MYLKGIGIASHPPVIIPEVGGGRELMAEKTVRGMRDLALKVAETKPKVIVCITPHGNTARYTPRSLRTEYAGRGYLPEMACCGTYPSW